MVGLATLEAQQWRNVWPRTCGFAFDDSTIVGGLSGAGGWAAARWSSYGLTAEGGMGTLRTGRATIVFRTDPITATLLAVHTHFSFDPSGGLMPLPGVRQG